MAPLGRPLPSPPWSDPPACLRSVPLAGLAPGPETRLPASLPKGPSSTGDGVSPGCLPWTRADSAGPAPGWCRLQGKCWSRQLSAGLPLGEGGEKSTCRAEQGRVGWGPTPPMTQQQALACWLVAAHLASASPGCSPGPPTAATPSQPCGGLQRPGHGPSSRGFLLGTGSPH